MISTSSNKSVDVEKIHSSNLVDQQKKCLEVHFVIVSLSKKPDEEKSHKNRIHRFKPAGFDGSILNQSKPEFRLE